MKVRNTPLARACAVLGLLAATSPPQFAGDDGGNFRLTSTEFENDHFLPLSAIYTALFQGVNVCSINGKPGKNESPQLSWTGAPAGTRSFTVVLYDATAAFTHWGMYNIPASLTSLAENAGAPSSTAFPQIFNDFHLPNVPPEYDGPCPPANSPPNLHRYVFTVYALDIDLTLPSSDNFPANAETLYQALIQAGQHGHILASATLTGLYSTTKM
jgi:Raf kinase inhibitor-like YbhB/YbcL family protein